MSATELLQDEHRRLEALLERCGRAGGGGGERAARAVASDLRQHWRLEEEVLYPVVSRMRDDGARAAVREALEQHHALDGLLAELLAVEEGDPRFDTCLRAVQQALAAHVQHEEQAIFRRAVLHLTPARLEKLAGQIRARRR